MITAEEQGKFIRDLRLKKGLSVKDFAALIGVRPGSIYNIELGYSYGTIETLRSIEHALDLQPASLVNPTPRHRNGAYDPTGLKFLRIKCNLTQSELAQFFGVTRNAINNLEQRQDESLHYLLPALKDFLRKFAARKSKQSSYRYDKIRNAFELLRARKKDENDKED